jgi:hypothetical protein
MRLLQNTSLTRRIVTAVMFCYFVFAAAVQYNDPDPVHWIAVYGLSAVCSLLAFTGRDRAALLYILIGMALTEMAITVDGLCAWIRLGSENLLTTKMSAEKPYIELGREFLGAAISLAAAVGYLWTRPRK